MVKWTAHAKAQLRHIHDYIAEDSPLYAKRVTETVVQRTVDLDQHRARVKSSRNSMKRRFGNARSTWNGQFSA